MHLKKKSNCVCVEPKAPVICLLVFWFVSVETFRKHELSKTEYWIYFETFTVSKGGCHCAVIYQNLLLKQRLVVNAGYVLFYH